MNFLAHIYLSSDNDLIKIGNFMVDGFGENNLKIILEVQKGIVLHRAIDTLLMLIRFLDKVPKKLHSRYHHMPVL
jgi:acyl carrier protein phosphodiesterase